MTAPSLASACCASSAPTTTRPSSASSARSAATSGRSPICAGSLGPLHLAMLRAARQQIPAGAVESAEPAALRMIAQSPNTTIDTRLAAADRAEAAGALPTDALIQIFESVAIPVDDAKAALEAGGKGAAAACPRRDLPAGEGAGGRRHARRGAGARMGDRAHARVLPGGGADHGAAAARAVAGSRNWAGSQPMRAGSCC